MRMCVVSLSLKLYKLCDLFLLHKKKEIVIEWVLQCFPSFFLSYFLPSQCSSALLMIQLLELGFERFDLGVLRLQIFVQTVTLINKLTYKRNEETLSVNF